MGGRREGAPPPGGQYFDMPGGRQLPLTGRQIYYRLVGAYGYHKTEQAFDNLGETLDRARRAGYIGFDLIRDDGAIESRPLGFASVEDFRKRVRELAEQGYGHDMLAGQPRHVEVWYEVRTRPHTSVVSHVRGRAPWYSARLPGWMIPRRKCP